MGAVLSQDDFEDRVAKLRAAGARPGETDANSGKDSGIESAMSFGLRAGAQFVSAVVIGGGAGWAIDRWLGTSPFGMLIAMVLAFVAAMTNVWLTMSKAVAVATVQAGTVSNETPRVGTAAGAGDGITDEIDGKSS
jgi:F0F1-type ATP synthase assembly protein I